MLTVTIPETELFDDVKGLFFTVKATTIRIEHSLVSVSKWESKWKKPFLDRSKPKTLEESIDYVRCMTTTQNVDPMAYYALTPENMSEINKYIDTEQTATWFSNVPGTPPSREIVTSEIIYYQMIAYGVPFECQKWHLSRLLTLLRVCEIKNKPGKKIPKSELMSRNRSLNAARRAAMHSKG